MNIELHLFAVNTKIQANKQSRYIVPSGKMIVDISKAWENMEGAEHERETALRKELLRWVTCNNCMHIKGMCLLPIPAI